MRRALRLAGECVLAVGLLVGVVALRDAHVPHLPATLWMELGSIAPPVGTADEAHRQLRVLSFACRRDAAETAIPGLRRGPCSGGASLRVVRVFLVDEGWFHGVGADAAPSREIGAAYVATTEVRFPPGRRAWVRYQRQHEPRP